MDPTNQGSNFFHHDERPCLINWMSIFSACFVFTLLKVTNGFSSKLSGQYGLKICGRVAGWHRSLYKWPWDILLAYPYCIFDIHKWNTVLAE